MIKYNLRIVLGSICISIFFYLIGYISEKRTSSSTDSFIRVPYWIERIIFPFTMAKKGIIQNDTEHSRMCLSIALCGMAELCFAITVIYGLFMFLKHEAISAKFVFLFDIVSCSAVLFGTGVWDSINKYKCCDGCSGNGKNLFFAVLGILEIVAVVLWGLTMWFGWL